MMDAGLIYILPDVWVNPHPCNPDTIQEDFYNCGMCNNVCDSIVSDRCLGGQCLCGNEERACGNTGLMEECRFGSCLMPDLSGRICEFDNTCPAGFGCIYGHCTSISCVPEVCDSVDNDCDGAIDGTGSFPLSRWCYDDDLPADRLLNLPCQRGVQVCDNGVWQECEGAVTPVSETGYLGCNGLDEDCDGCPDGIWDEETSMCTSPNFTEYDVVYIIDTSASMGGVIEASIAATAQFSDIYSRNPNFRFGLVLFPPITRSPTGLDYTLTLPLSRYEDFLPALAGVVIGSGSAEASYDVVASVANGYLSDLIGWRRTATRIIILFTNERGQSYSLPRNDEISMCSSVIHGEFFATFNLPLYFLDFDNCSEMFALTDNPEQMLMDLTTIISNPCD